MRKYPHPIIFAIYAILFLYSHNVHQIGFRLVAWPLIVVGLLSIALYGLCLKLIKNQAAASLTASSFWVLFFSFGRVYSALTGTRVFVPGAGPYIPLLVLWGLIFGAAVYFFINTERSLASVGKFLNVVGMALLVIVVINLCFRTVTGHMIMRDYEDVRPDEKVVEVEPQEPPRDIYYIIPDGYPETEILREVYDYDNSYFIEALQDMGFYVADESRSNYPLTTLSLTSSLNMRYLDEFSEVPGEDSRDMTVPHQLIENNLVSRSLSEAGYEFVHFNSGWGPTIENRRADHNYMFGRLGDEFTEALVNQTPLMPVLGGDGARERVTMTFSTLPEVRDEVEGPAFVFAHILPPHPPYLFDSEGNPLQSAELEMTGDVWKNRTGYNQQLSYVNQRLESVIAEIIDGYEDEPDPIIILQSDHGTAYRGERQKGGWRDPADDFMYERTSILNAFYVPDDVRKHLYKSISPVNAFRLIFRHHFSADVDWKGDRIYFSNYERPFDLREITDLFD